MTIKRYDAHTNIDDFKSDWHESKDGPMVKYEDYAELAAENAGLKAAIDATIGWQQSTDPENVESVRMLVDIKTPATDDFLNEMRAHGVEMFANHIALYNSNSERHAHDFATQIRKGETK